MSAEPKSLNICRYYGCIIMIDLFQFFNMYTVRPTISRIIDDESLQRECAAYVARPGFPLPDCPKLLLLYSTLRPGKTLHDWIEEQDVDELGIDPRRFVTFGVIKGFLRRIHRFPVLCAAPYAANIENIEHASFRSPNPSGSRERGTSRTRQTADADSSAIDPSHHDHRRRRSRNASQYSDVADSIETSSYAPLQSLYGSSPTKRRQMPRPRGALSRANRPPNRSVTATVVDVASVALDSLRREAEDRVEDSPWLDRGSSTLLRTAWPPHHDGSSWSRSTIRKRPSTTSLGLGQSGTHRAGVSGFSKLSDEARHARPMPEELPGLLDGTHHEDDLCVRYGVAWTDLEAWFLRIGGAPRGMAGGDDERDWGRWEDETPMMSGFQKPGAKSWRGAGGGARGDSREAAARAGVSGFMQWGLEPPNEAADPRGRSRSRERGDYGSVKLILK